MPGGGFNTSANKLGSKTARVMSKVLRDGSMDSVAAVSNLFSCDDLDMLKHYDNCHIGRDALSTANKYYWLPSQ
eukprot:scaffold142205_cov53-Cyclotella_meneghiniana.AAC.1